MYKANSPIHVSVPVISPINSQIADSIKVNLSFWNGFKNTPPLSSSTTNIYSFTKQNKIGTTFLQQTGVYTFDVADFIKDIINFNIPPSLATNLYTVDNAIWWDYNVEYLSISGNTFVDTNPTSLANLGYSYGIEAPNQQTPTNRILMETNVKYMVARNSTFVIPIISDETIDTSIYYTTLPTHSITNTVVIPATLNAAEIQKNLILDISTISDDDTQIAFTSYTSGATIETTFIVDIVDECMETPVDLAFINKEGGLQFLTFFKSKEKTLAVDTELFNSRFGRASDGYHQNKLFDINGKVSTKINSGFVDESLNTVFKQLLLSSLVWEITVDKTFNPITITTKTLSFKTRLNDKLINYEISYENAYNEIQQY